LPSPPRIPFAPTPGFFFAQILKKTAAKPPALGRLKPGCPAASTRDVTRKHVKIWLI
jgi:hypothetical protein